MFSQFFSSESVVGARSSDRLRSAGNSYGASRRCRLEQLEDRVMLDASGLVDDAYLAVLFDLARKGVFYEAYAPLEPGEMVRDSRGYLFGGSDAPPGTEVADVPLNSRAADTTNTDQLRLGGGLGLDLSAEGYTVGRGKGDGRIYWAPCEI